MNLNEALGLLDLHVEAILEIVQEPSVSVVHLILLEPGAVDPRRNVGELESEVDVAPSSSSATFCKKAASKSSRACAP